MRYPNKVEYQIFPRMSALSEVLWTPKEKKNGTDFEKRLRTQYKRYTMWGANYSKAFYEIEAGFLPAQGNKGVQVKLESKDKTGKMMYGVTGKHFQKHYTAPIIINENAQVTGAYFKEGQLMDSISMDLKINKATGKKITVSPSPLSNYQGNNGAFTLVDGIINTRGMGCSNEFIGYRGKEMQAVIDLGDAQKISSVTAHSITSGGSRVRPPESMTVEVSEDGKTYKSLGFTSSFTNTLQGKGTLQISFDATNARFVKVTVKPVLKIAEGTQGAGEEALMFLDAIELNYVAGKETSLLKSR